VLVADCGAVTAAVAAPGTSDGAFWGKATERPSGRSRSVPSSQLASDLADLGVAVGSGMGVEVLSGTNIAIAGRGVTVGIGPRRVGAEAPPSSQLSSVKPTMNTTVLLARRRLLGEIRCNIVA
jgi:hypothetical protein